LQPIADRLILADISERCLDVCRERFAGCANVEYRLLDDRGFDPWQAEEIDGVWSYDVFVHVNPADTSRYLRALSRIMKPSATAVIHHCGEYASEKIAREGFRAHVTGDW